MTIGIRYAARSDVGMLREGNEDSAYAGARLLVVADGMGGHVGGEIASAAAVNALRPLDTDVPTSELHTALQHAVKQANENLHGIVESDPSLQGMGTTLTAMLWAGPHVALIHIGDSRAYLLRNGELFQITHDHTLVQSLVDEGRITLDEAASHPQRSLLLRALDGRGEVEPDISLREAQVGDRYLLCSDGLSSVVSAETIHQVLTQVEDPEAAIRQLIDLANRGGGPDNITCVLADVVELVRQQPAGTNSIVAGAAANTASRERIPRGGPGTPGGPAGPGGHGGIGRRGGPGGPGRAEDTPAQRAAALRDTMPQPPIAVDDAPPPAAALGAAGERMRPSEVRSRRGWTWLVVALVIFVLLVGGGGYAGWRYVQSGYYVGDDRGNVAIFQGSPDGIFGFGSSKIKERPNPPILIADLPPADQESVRQNIDGLDTIAKARSTVNSLRAELCAYRIGASGNQVVIFKGKDQPRCGNVSGGQIVPGTQRLEFKTLPLSMQDQVRETIRLNSRQDAETRFNVLVNAARDCSADPSSSRDCPQKKSS
ncbi:MAG TPA: Stp1/IreP family PP2C-type Ser/Thr phosphatase [Streptosporangiaceae bacterium]|jgi:protein phosphatase|nr:Stp1/IreP family PP2C-type Ser/Thr phosphatase [Streptosporangiaceae bacterium]